MIKQIKYTLLILGFLSSSAVSLAHSPEEARRPATLSVIHSRKSVRTYTNQQISSEDIETILRAGMSAPSASNAQRWAFIVVTDRNQLDKFSEELMYGGMIKQVNTAIVVCASPEKMEEPMLGFSLMDSACAAENMLLAIEAMGLGAVWVAIYPIDECIQLFRDTLNIPQNIIPLTIIPIGYPTGKEKAEDKFKQEKIHWEKW